MVWLFMLSAMVSAAPAGSLRLAGQVPAKWEIRWKSNSTGDRLRPWIHGADYRVKAMVRYDRGPASINASASDVPRSALEKGRVQLVVEAP